MSPNIYTYVCAFMYFIKFMAKQKIHYDRLNKKANNGIGISKHEICAQLLLFLLIELFLINQTIGCNGALIKALKIKSKDVFCILVLERSVVCLHYQLN